MSFTALILTFVEIKGDQQRKQKIGFWTSESLQKM
jgi:hypothetical protein